MGSHREQRGGHVDHPDPDGGHGGLPHPGAFKDGRGVIEDLWERPHPRQPPPQTTPTSALATPTSGQRHAHSNQDMPKVPKPRPQSRSPAHTSQGTPITPRPRPPMYQATPKLLKPRPQLRGHAHPHQGSPKIQSHAHNPLGPAQNPEATPTFPGHTHHSEIAPNPKPRPHPSGHAHTS